MFLFDSKTFDEIPFSKDSVWTNDHFCFINTTDISKLHFDEQNDEAVKICNISIFDEFQGRDSLTEKIVSGDHNCPSIPTTKKISTKQNLNSTSINVFMHPAPPQFISNKAK